MTEGATPDTGSGQGAGESAGNPEGAGKPTLRQLWQVPALVLAGGLLVGGVAMAFLTKPKPNYDGLFTRSEALIGEEKYAEAVDSITKDVGSFAQKGELSGKQLQKYHSLLGRSLAMGQKAMKLDRAENNRAIVQQFTQVEKVGGRLESYDVKLLADALVSLGKTSEAIERIDTIKDAKPELRIEVYQRVVEMAIAGKVGGGSVGGHGAAHADSHDDGHGSAPVSGHGAGNASPELAAHAGAAAGDGHGAGSGAGPTHDEADVLTYSTALELIGRLAADADLPQPVRVWAVLKQAEILLEEGHPDQAERRLQQTMLRLDRLDPRERAELLVLLARAYSDQGNFEGAERQLEVAAKELQSNDTMMADVLLAQARVNYAQGQASRAIDGYSQVMVRFPSSSGVLAAMFGLARVEAEEGLDDDAGHHYDELLEKLRSEGYTRSVNAEVLISSLLSHFKDRFDAGEIGRALRYATLAQSLAGEDGPGPSVLIALARVNQAMGEMTLEAANVSALDATPLSLAAADPATAAVAREHFIRAGNQYRQHAQSVVVDNTEMYGSSLWASAAMFDRAGDLDEAISVLRLFVAGFPGDSRLSEAKFKLAEAYFASGDMASAQRMYRELIENREGVAGTGPYADQSVVPLARTLLSDGDVANDDEGERWLVRAVGGEFGGPGTKNYRDGLDELARLYYRTSRHVEAISRLGEFVERYGSAETDEKGDAAIRMARYRLADARRQFAAETKVRLDREKMPDAERQRLAREREASLRDALGEFELVRRGFENVRHRTPLEDTCLRNAHFYLGECAFELAEHDDAIRYYAAAKERYPRDPASLVAMVQIVGAYQAMGETEKARTANARARAFFESLPDEVWNDPTLPMSRGAWQRWLDSTLQLDRSATARPGEGE